MKAINLMELKRLCMETNQEAITVLYALEHGTLDNIRHRRGL
jgi:hypothetical protein